MGLFRLFSKPKPAATETVQKYVPVDGGVTKVATRQGMVDWLDASKENRAIVKASGGGYAYVGTIHPKDGAPAYIRTHADGEWNDNLLALPEFN